MIAATLFAAGSKLPRPRAGHIDAHSHVWSPDLARWPREPSDIKLAQHPFSFTPDELLAHAQPCGVTGAVLIQMSFYGFNNSYLLDCVARHPDRFVGVAVVDHTAAGAEAEMRRLVDHGARGFRIGLRNRPAAWLESPGMDLLWRFAARNRVAVCPLMDVESVPAVARMCRRHPDTIVVVDHLARIGAGGSIRDEDVRSLCSLAAEPKVHVKVSAFYALGAGKAPYLDLVPMIRRVFEAYGPRRLMWGSDSPFQVAGGHRYADSYALVHDHLDFLSSADKEELLRLTSERIFFQGGPA